MSRKTKLALWLVSHCETDNKREDYVKSLQKYIPVDIFGYCGQPPPQFGKLVITTYQSGYSFVCLIVKSKGCVNGRLV